MKRAILLILMLMLLVDLAEDGHLGRVKFFLPQHSAKTTVTSSSKCPASGQSGLGLDLASPIFPGSLYEGHTWSIRSLFFVPPTLRIMHCCRLSSAGGIPG
jgi:hypothetical protein